MFDAAQRSLLALRNATLEIERSPGMASPTDGDAAPRQIGEWIHGRYRILAVVGQGGMGRVYRVSDTLHPERDLALKTLAAPLLSGPRVDLFRAEFRTMAELSHPNIARVYDFETLAGGADCAFTMEYIAGQDLLRASESSSLEQILDWTVEACRALHYLHRRGVTHADFKPQNVLVTPAGVVKVLDFGLSGAVGAGLLLGTPAYMAPELQRGATVDERVDLYALGVTLYQLIFRRLPFSGEGLDDLLRQHAGVPLSFPDHRRLDERLRAVIARLCAKSPDDRFASANAVIEAVTTATGRGYPLETRETRRSYASSARLVGREEERDRLLAWCLSRTDGASAGEAVLFTVSGPSGVGKSRLLREAQTRLQLGGVPFVEVSCYEGGFGEWEPLKAMSEALRRLGRARGLDALEGAYRPTLDWLSDGGAADERRSLAEEESRRRGRLRDLADFALDLSRELGVVLHLDDLHWARSATTDFLELQCERQTARQDAGAASRLALVVSYRDDEVAGRPVEALLRAVDGERRTEVRLAPLPPERTAELIAAMLGSDGIPAAFSTRVSDETGGNPFFIEEVLRGLLDRGDVFLDAGQWAARTDVAHLELPATIAAVLERRLAGTPRWQRELLAWMAVYAQPMPLAVLVAASGIDRDTVERGVRDLVERQMAATVGDERARPAHDRLRHFLYQGETPEARREKHGAIARALERLAATDGDYLFERAHHYWFAEEEASARRWCARAAASAEQSFATDAAIDNYDRLRALADRRGDETGRREATDQLLELCTVAGQYDRIVSVAGGELARRAEPLERARLLQLQGEALGSRGQLPEGIDRLHQACALLGGGVPRARIRRRWFIARHYAMHRATLALRRGDLVVAARLSASVRRRREILGRCYALLAVYALLSGDDEGVGLSFAGINAARPLGRHEVSRWLLQNVALAHHFLGQRSASERMILEARRMAETPLERAILLPVEVLAREMTQAPIYRGQRPVNAHEAELIAAIDLLSSRSKALFAHLARAVAAILLWHYAPRFVHRPEPYRWADAMRGTVHHGVVRGAAAVMALVDGQRPRAERAYAQAQQGETTPFYRAFVDANYAFRSAILGDVEPALRCMRALRATLATMETRAAMSLWAPTAAIAAALALGARGTGEPWLRDILVECVARLDRAGRRLPPTLELGREAGRLALGRSSVAALRRARDRSFAGWSAEQAFAGHSDCCLAAALALHASRRPADRAAAPAWSAEALRSIEGRFPDGYVARVRELLRAAERAAPA